LKENQPGLLSQVKSYFNKPENNAISHSETNEGHGRSEKQTCYISEDVEELRSKHKKWKSIINTIIKVESDRTL